MGGDIDLMIVSRCGVNCGLCVGFLGYNMDGTKRESKCGGCRTLETACGFVKNQCKKLADKDEIAYCYECSDFPCENMRKADEYYSKKYDASLIENLTYIKNGLEAFTKREKEKWKCPTCGGVICIHTRRCYSCNP
ncbi:MAG: DUF3795 domain-containing protein [Candidatus Bathyarchaeia archaeon]